MQEAIPDELEKLDLSKKKKKKKADVKQVSFLEQEESSAGK